jgi:hypothetical protein
VLVLFCFRRQILCTNTASHAKACTQCGSSHVHITEAAVGQSVSDDDCNSHLLDDSKQVAKQPQAAVHILIKDEMIAST